MLQTCNKELSIEMSTRGTIDRHKLLNKGHVEGEHVAKRVISSGARVENRYVVMYRESLTSALLH